MTLIVTPTNKMINHLKNYVNSLKSQILSMYGITKILTTLALHGLMLKIVQRAEQTIFFVKSDCKDHVKNIIVRRLPGTYNNKIRLSDHRYLKFTLNFNKLERVVGYWKMYVSHLENKDYKQGFVDMYNNIDSILDPFLKWESFKINVRDYSNKYAKQSKYNVKHKIKIIEDRIDYIENLPCSEINM